MTNKIVHPCKSLNGAVDIPGDKSISHRALMFAPLALGTSVIDNLLEGHDCMATLQVMRGLGAHIELSNNQWLIHGQGARSLKEPSSVLDCKNSGTTIRLLAGLMSAMPFMSILDGSDQVKSRPMGRVIKPLSAMSAQIFGRQNNQLAPLVCLPSQLHGGRFRLEQKSAQVKSALILAGLFADSDTLITNTQASRDHTEIMLLYMGAPIKSDQDSVLVRPLSQELSPLQISIPGDISSAAFLLVAGALRAAQPITLYSVGVNPTRTGIIDALRIMGADLQLGRHKIVGGEQVADLTIGRAQLKGAVFAGDHVVRMIDEIPVLALAATQAQGTTVIKDAAELKVKESNRIAKTVELLSSLGANISETDDGMIIHGPSKLHGGEVSSYGDHRLALMMSIAGLVASGPVKVNQTAVTDDSFPGFFASLKKLGASVSEA